MSEGPLLACVCQRSLNMYSMEKACNRMEDVGQELPSIISLKNSINKKWFLEVVKLEL